MRRLYSVLLWFAVPVASLVVFWRGLWNRDYWRGWRQRFGSDYQLSGEYIWVHAVSVGEVQAASIVIRALWAELPGRRVLLTCATPTGRDRARKQLVAGVDIRFAPYDLPLLVRRVLRGGRISLLVVLETELWPNLLHQCALAQVPVCLISARVSERSTRRLLRFRGLLSTAALGNMTVAAQTAADAQRFAQLGVPPAALSVCGNIKFDQQLDGAVQARGDALRARYAGVHPLWVAGSTHAGEEEAVLDAHAALIELVPDARLVIAPRYPHRFSQVAALLQARNLAFERRSQQTAAAMATGEAAAAKVLLLDTLGELGDFYAAADLAFVGGSLVPVGGHNLLEPAALGVATVTGAHQFNAPEVARVLCERGALCMVSSPPELAAAVLRLMRDAVARQKLAAAARTAVSENRGALARIMQLLRARLELPA